jgi:hypothetical protein
MPTAKPKLKTARARWLDAKHWFEVLWGKLTVQGQVVNINGRDVSLKKVELLG